MPFDQKKVRHKLKMKLETKFEKHELGRRKRLSQVKEEYADFDLEIDPGYPTSAQEGEEITIQGTTTQRANFFMVVVKDATGTPFQITPISPSQPTDTSWTHTFSFVNGNLPVPDTDYVYQIQGTYFPGGGMPTSVTVSVWFTGEEALREEEARTPAPE